MSLINRIAGSLTTRETDADAPASVPAPHILRIDASMRHGGSTSRQFVDRLIDRLVTRSPGADVTTRDLTATALPLLTEPMIGAYFTKPEDRTDEHRALLGPSDALVAELKAADILVIGTPIYNFGVPAALKAWIDLIARAGETFKYTENGPVGLLTGKKAYVVIASGGTRAFSEIDFAGPYLRHVLAFVGVTEVEFVTADALMQDLDGKLVEASARIAELVPQAA